MEAARTAQRNTTRFAGDLRVAVSVYDGLRLPPTMILPWMKCPRYLKKSK